MIFTFVIKDYEESPSVVIYFELSPHRLDDSTDKSADKDYVTDWLAFKLTNVIRSSLRIHHHAHSDRRENFRTSLTVLVEPSLSAKTTATLV